jgi:hypothetical protein
MTRLECVELHFIPPYVFMAWYVVTYRNNSTFCPLICVEKVADIAKE